MTVEMKKEVYGTITFDVSMEVEADNEMDALREMSGKLSDEKEYKNVRLVFEDKNGNEVKGIVIHNYYVDMSRYYGVGE